MHTILVVEDSKFLKIANERILSKAGYQVVGATDGEEALRIAGDRHPDLILLDMMLPKMGGLEVLQSLKRNPATTQIPVIILTSLSQKNEGKLCQAGAFAFVEKGSLLDNPRLLLGAIEQALRNGGSQHTQEQSAQALLPVPGVEPNENYKPC